MRVRHLRKMLEGVNDNELVVIAFPEGDDVEKGDWLHAEEVVKPDGDQHNALTFFPGRIVDWQWDPAVLDDVSTEQPQRLSTVAIALLVDAGDAHKIQAALEAAGVKLIRSEVHPDPDAVFPPDDERPEPKAKTVQVPGEVFVHLDDNGDVERIAFSPHASNAGYFGPHANVVEGDQDFDVEDTEGPFWTVVQRALIDNKPISWEE